MKAFNLRFEAFPIIKKPTTKDVDMCTYRYQVVTKNTNGNADFLIQLF
jgi:hypothetical protein